MTPSIDSSVSDSKRRVILVHGDTDGVVSGALAYYFYTSRGEDAYVYFTHPAGLAGDIREFIHRGDNVFIADIALSEAHLKDIVRELREISSMGEIVYIDHHPAPLGLHPKDLPGIIVHDTCCSASELTFKYLAAKGLDEEYSRVALYGAIGDYLDETDWVRRELENWDKRTIYFEAGVLIQGLEGSRRLHDFKRNIVRLLAQNRLPSSDPELLLRALVESRRDEEMRMWIRTAVKCSRSMAYIEDPPGSLGKAASYARVYGRRPIGMAFEKRGRIAVMSLRSHSVNLNLMLRKIAVMLGGTGGGHEFAAGARIPVDRMGEFIRLVDEYYERFLQAKNNGV
jgi:single-stranded-DNA-specific exonuclease